MALVNLYSDTQTQPTAAMRAAIAAAEVGDEQRGADPTTRALEERVAALLGHEAAVFLPSGTMCNEIAIRLHIRPGGERMFIGRDTHPLIAEAGGPAQLSGAVITEVDGDSGMFTAQALQRRRSTAAGPAGATAPRQRLVCVEQTTNMGGGRVWPLEQVRAVLDVARRDGPRDPPRRRAADERGGGQRRRCRRLGRRLRQRMARLHQGPRRPGRRVPGRLGGLHRGGVALEADDGRRHAPVGHHRRGRPLRARPPRRAPGRRPRARPPPGRGPRRAARRRARPRHRADQHRHLRGARRGRLHRGARGRRTS